MNKNENGNLCRTESGRKHSLNNILISVYPEMASFVCDNAVQLFQRSVYRLKKYLYIE